MKNDGMIYVALIVIVLMAGYIAAQQAMISETIPGNLPECQFSAVINWQGGGAHPGYWVELDDSLQKRECIIRFDRGRVSHPD
jgi:hypothetical protein